MVPFNVEFEFDTAWYGIGDAKLIFQSAWVII